MTAPSPGMNRDEAGKMSYDARPSRKQPDCTLVERLSGILVWAVAIILAQFIPFLIFGQLNEQDIWVPRVYLVLALIAVILLSGWLGEVMGVADYFRVYGQFRDFRETSRLLVTAALVSCVTCFFFALVFCCGCPPRTRARQASCLSNIKQISLALVMYTQDYDDCLPPASRWNAAFVSEAVKPHNPHAAADSRDNARHMLHCPSVHTNLPCYALNRRISGQAYSSTANRAKTVMIFDARPGLNRNGGQELLPIPARHEGGNNIGFADGHVQWTPPSKKLIWKPGETQPRNNNGNSK